MRLIEVIEGEYTTPETTQAAVNFAQAIRKTPIRCAEVPGFVVNRILKLRCIRGVAPPAGDRSGHRRRGPDVAESRAAPVGPFQLADQLGLDTVLHVAEYLRDCYGERFFVHEQMRALVQQGHLGAKTGKGFYEHGS